MNELPDKFTVTITEEDRQTAAIFDDSRHCLLATAVRRVTGRQDVSESVDGTHIGRVWFQHEKAGMNETCAKSIVFSRWGDNYHYGKQVVGKTFHLQKS